MSGLILARAILAYRWRQASDSQARLAENPLICDPANQGPGKIELDFTRLATNLMNTKKSFLP